MTDDHPLSNRDIAPSLSDEEMLTIRNFLILLDGDKSFVEWLKRQAMLDYTPAGYRMLKLGDRIDDAIAVFLQETSTGADPANVTLSPSNFKLLRDLAFNCGVVPDDFLPSEDVVDKVFNDACAALRTEASEMPLH